MICPEKYNKLILEKRKCVKSCDEDEKYKYEFLKTCYEECPEGSNALKKNNRENEYYCETICTEEKPFEMISTQKCVKNCPIKDLNQKLCKL